MRDEPVVFSRITQPAAVWCAARAMQPQHLLLFKKNKKNKTPRTHLEQTVREKKKKNQGKITAQNNESVLLLKRQKSKDNGTKAPWGKK